MLRCCADALVDSVCRIMVTPLSLAPSLGIIVTSKDDRGNYTGYVNTPLILLEGADVVDQQPPLLH